jgi:uncharacterized GH25 family protein
MLRRFAVVLTALMFVPSMALAHFPFLHLKAEGERPVLHVYFAESAEPDDPALLDRLTDSQAWRLSETGELTPLELTKGDDSLTVESVGKGPAAYLLTKDFGVISRGDSTFRLMYYAKTYSDPEAWKFASAKHSQLDVTPSKQGDQLVLTVTWNGKPVRDAEIVVQGGIEHLEGKSDAKGQFVCPVLDPDLYSIRARHVVEGAGTVGDKAFQATRHYATLTLDLK